MSHPVILQWGRHVAPESNFNARWYIVTCKKCECRFTFLEAMTSYTDGTHPRPYKRYIRCPKLPCSHEVLLPWAAGRWTALHTAGGPSRL